MADVFTREKRSKVMAAIRSKDNEDTELKLVRIFRRYRITGWRRHSKIHGKPDFLFSKQGVVVFVDGCFWHGCPKHGHIPKSNTAFWRKKILRNKQRDCEVSKTLRLEGWNVVRFWEHDLSDGDRIAKRVGFAFSMAQKRR